MSDNGKSERQWTSDAGRLPCWSLPFGSSILPGKRGKFGETLEACYAGYPMWSERAALAATSALWVVSGTMEIATVKDWSEADTRRAWYSVNVKPTHRRLRAVFFINSPQVVLVWRVLCISRDTRAYTQK
jgi:hypothetical protein